MAFVAQIRTFRNWSQFFRHFQVSSAAPPVNKRAGKIPTSQPSDERVDESLHLMSGSLLKTRHVVPSRRQVRSTSVLSHSFFVEFCKIAVDPRPSGWSQKLQSSAIHAQIFILNDSAIDPPKKPTRADDGSEFVPWPENSWRRRQRDERFYGWWEIMSRVRPRSGTVPSRVR